MKHTANSTHHTTKKPPVLVLAGHDPSGGAGIQADIESIALAGGYAVSVITCLTAQNTRGVIQVTPQEPALFEQQLDCLLEDINISACKLGLVADSALIEIAYRILSRLAIPIVLDPVIDAGSGQQLSGQDATECMMSLLVPLSTIITPNSIEARQLSGVHELNTAAHHLMHAGAGSVLITGTHEAGDVVSNTLYTTHHAPKNYSWPRLPGVFHGSGCTLSAYIATRLALGDELAAAVFDAQTFTWRSLKHGLSLGKGQYLPNRLFHINRR